MSDPQPAAARQARPPEADVPSAGPGQDGREQGRSEQDGATSTGTYELLRRRLAAQSAELRDRADALNRLRTEHFGGSETAVIGTHRIRTEQNCTARDIVAVDGMLLFGYRVHTGLRATTVGDVFSLHRLDLVAEAGDEAQQQGAFTEVADDDPANFLADPEFTHDFEELLKYYAAATLLDLRVEVGRLLAVFQTGDTLQDIRAFRWDVSPDGNVTYRDDRGARDYTWPAPHDFAWREVTREMHIAARPPAPAYISLDDRVFIDLAGGRVELRIEDNTDAGKVIASETVEHPGQSLADMAVAWADLGGLTLVKIHPYREAAARYFVVNRVTGTADRIDAIGRSCQQLPDDHGIIFPGGYYLQSGQQRTFDPAALGIDIEALIFEEAVRSPNGEDVLFHYHGREDGTSLLLAYNLVRREIANPIVGHGFSLFDDGSMVVFRDRGEPSRIHQMQVWSTPFVSEVHHAAQAVGDTPMDRIGNADLVRAISDALAVHELANPDESGGAVPTATWHQLATTVSRTLDAYHWLGDDALFGDDSADGSGDLATPLLQVRDTAEGIIEEYDRVLETRARTAAAIEEAQTQNQAVIARADGSLADADAHIAALAEMRRQQGRIAGLRELRYVDLDAVESLATAAEEALRRVADRTVAHLSADDALDGHLARTEALATRAEKITRAVEAKAVSEEIDALVSDLQELADVVTGLEMADTTVRTGILNAVAKVVSGANRARAVLSRRRESLAEAEAADAFVAEFALLEGTVAAALEQSDTPAACDEQLGRLLVTVENLDAAFGHIESHAAQIDERRDEITNAFAARKQRLIDQRAAQATRIRRNADRLLDTVRRRAADMSEREDLLAFFTADPIVARIRSAADQLEALNQTVAAGELRSTLTAARGDAERALRDRADLYSGDGSTVKFGSHLLVVNTEPPRLSLVSTDEGLDLVLTGTDWREPVSDSAPELAGALSDLTDAERDALWTQAVPSETAELSRAEHLAGTIYLDAVGRVDGAPTLAELSDAAVTGALADIVTDRARAAYDQGYERGVHDADAALILQGLVAMHADAGPLRHPAAGRAAALLYLAHGLDPAQREAAVARAHALARLTDADPTTREAELAATEATAGVQRWLSGQGLTPASAIHASRARGPGMRELSDEQVRGGIAYSPGDLPGLAADGAGAFLLEQLAEHRGATMQVSAAAIDAADALVRDLDARGARDDVIAGLAALATGPMVMQLRQIMSWLQVQDVEPRVRDEAAALLLTGHQGLVEVEGIGHEAVSATASTTVTGLVSSHPRVEDGALEVRIDELPVAVARHRRVNAPRFAALTKARQDLVARRADELRLDDLTPRVFGGFVRNGLITDVYLPMIGANLAKQMGTAGGQQADQSGLLLLISPPGYGKTTLVEYIADRLGISLVKVSGPALGYGTTSLDPAAAPDATARAEVEKINQAFALGNNVLLYIDDIQHTSSEFLQKFISLCDGQRRIDAVRDGEAHTYDLRGKRFAVVMAGNPYTEAGQRFQIPDMLANRADTYNLGDVLSGNDELFSLSYLENALGSNEVLRPLTGAGRGDLMQLLEAARGRTLNTDALEGSYTGAEIEDMTRVLQHMETIQKTLLKVNEAYIASAAQADAYRTEPPFGLQGSYRNMAKLAVRVVPAMTDDELQRLIDDHYAGEAQTLTSGAEQNLLKLAELRGRLTPETQARWEEIKRQFRVRNAGDDAGDRIAGQIGRLADTIGNGMAVLMGPPIPDDDEDPSSAGHRGWRSPVRPHD